MVQVSFLRGFEMMLMQLNKKSTERADIVIRPQTGNLSMFEGKERAKIIQAGEEATKKALPAIKELLQKGSA